jgi:acyl carrier protein
MTNAEIIERLRQTMKKSSVKNADWDAISEQTTIASLGFDSLSILDLIYDIQQDFKVDFAPEELAAVGTVGKLATFLKEKGA